MLAVNHGSKSCNKHMYINSIGYNSNYTLQLHIYRKEIGQQAIMFVFEYYVVGARLDELTI